eukprot:6212819-Alexandrium_andersonii.AAC.1
MSSLGTLVDGPAMGPDRPIGIPAPPGPEDATMAGSDEKVLMAAPRCGQLPVPSSAARQGRSGP